MRSQVEQLKCSTWASTWLLQCLPQHWSAALECSPRTNRKRGFSGQTCVRKAAKKALLFSFFFPLLRISHSLNWLGVFRSRAVCFDKPEHGRSPSCGERARGRSVAIGRRRFFTTFGVLSVSLSFSLPPSFFFETTCSASPSSCHLPPESRADRRPTRPTPADVPEWTHGVEGGTRGREGAEEAE